MSDETNTKNRPSQKQIEAWKKEHKELYQFQVDDNILIIRKPGMNDLERALASDPKKKKAYNFHRSIIENCKLYADPGLLESDDNYLALISKLDEIVEIKEAELKKL